MEINFNGLILTFEELEKLRSGETKFEFQNKGLSGVNATLVASKINGGIQFWEAQKPAHEFFGMPDWSLFYNDDEGFFGYITDDMGFEMISFYVENKRI